MKGAILEVSEPTAEEQAELQAVLDKLAPTLDCLDAETMASVCGTLVTSWVCAFHPAGMREAIFESWLDAVRAGIEEHASDPMPVEQ